MPEYAININKPYDLFRVAVAKPKGSINNFIETINNYGGMSFSNNYDVEFQFKNGSGLLKRLNEYNIKFGSGSKPNGFDAEASTLIKLLCDEAQLPNVQATTGQITGRYLGEGLVNYPHTKLYSDFQLSWMCDANLTPLKFLHVWNSYIFQEYNINGDEINPGRESKKSVDNFKSLGFGGASTNPRRVTKLNYPDNYLANILITKTERSKNAANGRAPISYTMLDVFPYAIDAVPLSYGASQVTKVTANFYYARFHVNFNDVRNFDG